MMSKPFLVIIILGCVADISWFFSFLHSTFTSLFIFFILSSRFSKLLPFSWSSSSALIDMLPSFILSMLMMQVTSSEPSCSDQPEEMLFCTFPQLSSFLHFCVFLILWNFLSIKEMMRCFLHTGGGRTSGIVFSTEQSLISWWGYFCQSSYCTRTTGAFSKWSGLRGLGVDFVLYTALLWSSSSVILARFWSISWRSFSFMKLWSVVTFTRMCLFLGMFG